MIELAVAAGLVALCAAATALAVRAARRRSRARAERVLDDLAAAACAALAERGDGSRAAARALARYERAGERVARARTCRELELLVARHRLRRHAAELAARAAEGARGMLTEGIPARR